MSFKDKYSWQILTQFSAVIESYYRLGFLDANKGQDVVAIDRILKIDLMEEKYNFINEWDGMTMSLDSLAKHFAVEVERKSLHALSFYIGHKCKDVKAMALLAYSYYRKGLVNGLKVSQYVCIDYFKRNPSLEVHLQIVDGQMKRINRSVFIQEIALEATRIKEMAIERTYQKNEKDFDSMIDFINFAYQKEKDERWKILK